MTVVPAAPSGPAHPLHERWLSPEEVADRFHVTKKWLYKHKKNLPHSQPTRKTLRFPDGPIQRWFANRKHTIAYSFRGTKYRECSWSRNRQDAVRLLKKRLGEIGRGGFAGAHLERTTFDDLVKIITDEYDANKRRSKGRMLTAIAALRQKFGLTLVRDITFDSLNAYIADRLKDGIAPATVRYDLSVLRRALRLAERAGKAVRPPFPSVRVNNTRRGFFEEDQFRAVLQYLPEDIKPIVIFAYYTGWRIRSEVLPMEWRQVDLSAGTIRLEPGTTKNEEGRTFPFAMLPELAGVLLEQRRHTFAVQAKTGRFIPWVFYRDGRPIKDFYKAWRNACEAAGEGPTGSPMTFDGRLCGTLNGPAYPGPRP